MTRRADSMRLSAEMEAFATRLGHSFARPELLIRATTHASAGSVSRPHNQRLEFLGDRVLGLVISDALFSADTKATEGQLAPRFNALVRKEACADVAREIDLGAVLRLGRSEMLSGGRRKDALLGDAMEAVLAAVYLDGGLDAARAVILQHWRTRIDAVDHDARDPKTALQEWAQAKGDPPPPTAKPRVKAHRTRPCSPSRSALPTATRPRRRPVPNAPPNKPPPARCWPALTPARDPV